MDIINNNNNIYYKTTSKLLYHAVHKVITIVHIMPPSHQTKTMKTALRPENLDERNAVVVKKEK